MNKKIDKRRHYILVLDTETCNTNMDEKGRLDFHNGLCYDIGWIVADTKGNIYERRSFVNEDIFYGKRDLMQSCYYANKIPNYYEQIDSGERELSTTHRIRFAMLEDMRIYDITEVCAHNAKFDVCVLNSTLRYVTNGRYRYWFPYGTEVWDSMMMASSVVLQMPTYQKFCTENEYLTKNGCPRKTAEILYRFIAHDNEFEESHTGLEDVLIEYQIVIYCYRQHKTMKKVLYAGKKK